MRADTHGHEPVPVDKAGGKPAIFPARQQECQWARPEIEQTGRGSFQQANLGRLFLCCRYHGQRVACLPVFYLIHHVHSLWGVGQRANPEIGFCGKKHQPARQKAGSCRGNIKQGERRVRQGSRIVCGQTENSFLQRCVCPLSYAHRASSANPLYRGSRRSFVTAG